MSDKPPEVAAAYARLSEEGRKIANAYAAAIIAATAPDQRCEEVRLLDEWTRLYGENP